MLEIISQQLKHMKTAVPLGLSLGAYSYLYLFIAISVAVMPLPITVLIPAIALTIFAYVMSYLSFVKATETRSRRDLLVNHTISSLISESSIVCLTLCLLGLLAPATTFGSLPILVLGVIGVAGTIITFLPVVLAHYKHHKNLKNRQNMGNLSNGEIHKKLVLHFLHILTAHAVEICATISAIAIFHLGMLSLAPYLIIATASLLVLQAIVRIFLEIPSHVTNQKTQALATFIRSLLILSITNLLPAAGMVLMLNFITLSPVLVLTIAFAVVLTVNAPTIYKACSTSKNASEEAPESLLSTKQQTPKPGHDLGSQQQSHSATHPPAHAIDAAKPVSRQHSAGGR